ncbi:hypothetical protein ACFPT7_17910 [Acidicapsa dinghuensis]|uniref:Lipoprotein n=1 Tax=Acidicapsa dinghuensis TaxID=2218256 RepID=A0ABW1EIT7_9BACT|nr:hypothetical protein [Acidicapsa dinghuensis]
MTVLSNSDAILVAVPMVGILIACFFRLDEMFGKPKKKVMLEHRRQMSGWDENGKPICIDPDGGKGRQVSAGTVPVKARVRRDWTE